MPGGHLGPNSPLEAPAALASCFTKASAPGPEVRVCGDCSGPCAWKTVIPGYGSPTYSCHGCGNTNRIRDGVFHCVACAFIGCAQCTPKARPCMAGGPTAPPSQSATAEDLVARCPDCLEGLTWKTALAGYGSKTYTCDDCGSLRPLSGGVFHCGGCSRVTCSKCVSQFEGTSFTAVPAVPRPVPLITVRKPVPRPSHKADEIASPRPGTRCCDECRGPMVYKTKISGFGAKTYDCDGCGHIYPLQTGVFHCTACSLLNCAKCAVPMASPHSPLSPAATVALLALQRPKAPPPLPNPAVAENLVPSPRSRWCPSCAGPCSRETDGGGREGSSCYTCDGCGVLRPLKDGVFHCKACGDMSCPSCAPWTTPSSMLSRGPATVPGMVVTPEVPLPAAHRVPAPRRFLPESLTQAWRSL